MNPDNFLSLTPRRRKLRGLTCVIDSGLWTNQVEGLIELAGEKIDLVKFGWGTALVTNNLKTKIDLYQDANIPVIFGGTLTELVIARGKVTSYREWLKTQGINCVEVSDGSISLQLDEKLKIIEHFAQAGFTVYSEVGKKDEKELANAADWISQIKAELDAGATKVITEARESGTAGIFNTDGTVHSYLIEALADSIQPSKLIFEAPRKEQQVWFVRKFGPEVNLANIAPEDVIALETLRLGLRSDTIELALPHQ